MITRIEDSTATQRKYSFVIIWHTFDGGFYRFAVDSDISLAEAFIQTIGNAYLMGWTPPRWWQWWRWRDTRIGWKTIRHIEDIDCDHANRRPERHAT